MKIARFTTRTTTCGEEKTSDKEQRDSPCVKGYEITNWAAKKSAVRNTCRKHGRKGGTKTKAEEDQPLVGAQTELTRRYSES